MDRVMGNGKRNGDRRILRGKKRRQTDESEIKWCDIAPIECTCLGTNCKQKGGR